MGRILRCDSSSDGKLPFVQGKRKCTQDALFLDERLKQAGA